jgi:DNA-binding MarR family transcriptional regulator
MNRALIVEQSHALAALLPALMRKLFAGEDGLAAELPLAQLRVCGALGGGPQPMSALSRELGVSLSAITQIADRLERARLVKRVAKNNDRRVRCLQLTDRGAKMMRLRQQVRVERVRSVLGRLAPKARTETLSALHALIAACGGGRNRDGRPKRRASRP